MARVFGFSTVTDGIGMGPEGIKYSLVSCEVIADSIEVAVNGQRMDRVVAVGGCVKKKMPWSIMAMARMKCPESSLMPAPSSRASGRARSSQL
jgi:dihydroxy-acid dehydratase